MRKHVLITGVTGFVGNFVVKSLLEKGFAVTATSSDREKASKAPWFTFVNYIPFRFNELEENVDYFKFFGKPDILIHLAWEGLPNYKSDFHIQENLPRHKLFLHNLISHGLNDLTITGTCFEYGMQNGALMESMPVEPDNPYAVAKNELRKYIAKLREAYLFSFKWARLFYMYGKGQNPNSLLSQLERALANGEAVFNMSGGEQIRDYLPVETVAKYIIAIADQRKLEGVINVGSGIPISVKEFIEKYLKDKNQAIRLNLGYYPYPDFEPMYFWGDITKLKTILQHEQSNPEVY
jgi:nucleoside-diphosphate-sugar epimerase